MTLWTLLLSLLCLFICMLIRMLFPNDFRERSYYECQATSALQPLISEGILHAHHSEVCHIHSSFSAAHIENVQSKNIRQHIHDSL
jgi:hypothetical protein